MKAITKYLANDGSEHSTSESATSRDRLTELVNKAMAPLGNRPKEVEEGKGWIQHSLETVVSCRDAILDLAEAIHGKSFPILSHRGADVHPLSGIGRILTDTDGPISRAWNRFCMIDTEGREHQQCYYAYTAGPLPKHVCVEDREVAQFKNYIPR